MSLDDRYSAIGITRNAPDGVRDAVEIWLHFPDDPRENGVLLAIDRTFAQAKAAAIEELEAALTEARRVEEPTP